ncbi:MAG: insulinase family protein [Gemmatimonadota bacterium]|nr:insulinase family protein [Gemmatimonadota bacterium]
MISLPLVDPHSVTRITLANGMRVLIRRNTSAPVVAIVTWVNAGYFDETDDVVGIAHVLEHMYFKGTARRGVGEISQQTKAAGGYLNAGTIYDHTSYYTVLPASGFVEGLEIQSDAYANSAIDAEELRKELEVIIQEANRKADTASAVTTETLYELLHDTHRMRRWRIGREAGLRTLTRDDLVRFYRTYYRPSNTILSIVGDVDVDEARRHVERLYGPLADAPIARDRGPAEHAKREFRYREVSGDITQSQIAIGWRTPGSLDADTALLDLASAVLGSGRASRLYRAVRERRLAASVSAYDYTPSELGVFVMHLEGPPETARDAAVAAWGQLRDLRESGVPHDELWRARRLFESQWVRRLETMEGQANYLAEWEALGNFALGDRYLERLLTATAAQVGDAVRRHLVPEAAAVMSYQPAGTEPLATSADDLRYLLERQATEPLTVSPPRVPAPAAAAPRVPALERSEGPVRVYRMKSGIPVLVRRKPGSLIAHIGAFSLGGACDEDARVAGLTTLMARTAIKATTHRSASQIAEDAELLGGAVSPAVGSEHFGWMISVPKDRTDAATELLADVVQHPIFPAELLETERGVAIADLAQLRDDMYRYPMRLLTRAAFSGHPYGVPSNGTEESLPLIDIEHVAAWHRRKVIEGPMVIAIVADLDDDAMAAMIEQEFGELLGGEAPAIVDAAWPTAPLTVVEHRDKAQTALALAFPGPARADDARYAAHLLSSIASGLGGRFFEELRDRQSLAYTVQAFANERRAAGLFAAYIATAPEKEEVARAGLLAEFAKFREMPVTADELTRAKQYSIGTHAISQQSGGSVLGDLLDAWLFGRLGELEEFETRVLAVTADDLLQLARRYFDESRLVTGVVRGGAPKLTAPPAP